MIYPTIAVLLLALLPSVVVAQVEVDVTAFCATRPVGLYCSPQVRSQKIECPSGEIFDCPKPNEKCQERGILKQYGFKGGIARCVPNIPDADVAAFCMGKEVGTYCYGDPENNIRIACPSGLIFKCVDEPHPHSRKCVQKKPQVAVCHVLDDGSGGSSGNCSGQVVTLTITETEMQTKTKTETLPRKTKTVTETLTETLTCPPLTATFLIPSVFTPEPVPMTKTKVDTTEWVQVATATSLWVETVSGGSSSTSVSVSTKTFDTDVATATSVVIVYPSP